MKPAVFALAATLLGATPCLAQIPPARPGQAGWAHTDQGCLVWSAATQEGETASWSGACTNGRTNGAGILVWRWKGRQARYDGTMRDGKLDGHGTYFASNGLQYEGEWRDDQKNGTGTLNWPSGDSYEGSWHNDLPDGAGIFTQADGTVFNGIWRQGCFRDGDRVARIGVPETACR